MKLVFGILFVTLFSQSIFAKALVGVVDVQKVLLSINEGKAVRKKLEKFFKDKQVLLKKDEEKFQTLQKSYEKQQAVMNDKTKKEKEGKMRELYMSIQNKTMEYQKELQEMEKELKGPLVDKINGMVEVVSKAESLDLTIVNDAGILLYAKDKKEITEKVIETYNKKYTVK